MQKFRMNCVFTTMMNISTISNLFGKELARKQASRQASEFHVQRQSYFIDIERTESTMKKKQRNRALTKSTKCEK